ncbi:MAG TPA: class I SAM-dependent methyltransferase [Burkholderiales bacterium]|nr:class I SAM-dependent methyltransferase [Burkholderiales bacterium]
MDQTKIWAHFQNDEDGDAAFNSHTRYAFITDRVAPSEKVLNVGVGRGGLERLLAAKGVDFSCLDPDERSIDRIRQELRLAERAVAGYSQSMPFGGETFDVVILSEVLEHLADGVLSATLVEVHRILKLGGRFIGTVPADENLADGRVVCPHCGEIFHRWGHVRSFSEAGLVETLRQYFRQARISRHFFGDPKQANVKGKLEWLAKRALLAAGLHGRNETFFFEAVR